MFLRETGPKKLQSNMAAFRTVPERLLRPVARSMSGRKSEFLAPKSTFGAPRTYRAALCKELGKPLVVEQVPATEKLKDSQVCSGVRQNYRYAVCSIGTPVSLFAVSSQ